MYNNWSQDLEDSIKATAKIMDKINSFIAGTIYSIESSNNEILQMLDQYSGIDLIVLKDKALRGIASRVQWGNTWDSFTIRKERHTKSTTEYEKRLKSIENGEFYPALTMQAYFNNRQENKLLSLAVMKTKDLYELLTEQPELFHQRKSDNIFSYVLWQDIKNLTNKKILIYRAKNETKQA